LLLLAGFGEKGGGAWGKKVTGRVAEKRGVLFIFFFSLFFIRTLSLSL
jgi:hypothetical protein